MRAVSIASIRITTRSKRRSAVPVGGHHLEGAVRQHHTHRWATACAFLVARRRKPGLREVNEGRKAGYHHLQKVFV